MSTELDSKRNGCYNITATRFAGRGGLMCQLTVGDGSQWMCIALHKDDVIEMCERIIEGMKEFDHASDG